MEGNLIFKPISANIHWESGIFDKLLPYLKIDLDQE